MQIFYKIVVLLSWLCYSIWLLQVCVAQPSSTQQVCGEREHQSCNRTDVDVCATNGQNCKRFPSNCELQRENCNVTLATAWNRTSSVQCSHLRLNATGLCACSTLGLRECSNRTVTPGICAHGPPSRVGGHHAQQCHLFRTECDLRMARCAGQEWHTIENRQCRGFALNQTNPCHCPKLLGCSSVNRIQLCVQVGQTGLCRHYDNECAMESSRCDGEALRIIGGLHCHNFPVKRIQNCLCPRLLNCQRNNTNICVRNTDSQCQLLANECDLEQRNCEGSGLQVTRAVQCLNITLNEQKSCSCPRMTTCSRNSTRVCVKTRRGCKLMTTECEVEEAKCRGEVLETLNILQCQGFSDNEEKSCFCPQLQTCTRNETQICARTSSSNCTLLSNECELEQHKCQNQNVTVLNPIQCRSLTLGQNGSCACPTWLNCSQNTSQVCIRSATGCKLLRNQCELEQEKCQGNVTEVVSPLQCRGFEYGQQRNCSCPNLQTCARSTNVNICIGNRNGCRVLRNQCELEEMKCRGENVNIVHPIQCRSLTSGQNGSCACPTWFNCSLNPSQVCIQSGEGCKLLRNLCELEREKCQRNVTEVVSPLQCRGFEYGQQRNCSCPNLQTCARSPNVNICIGNRNGCRVLRNQCELEEMKCRGENFTVLPEMQCRSLTAGQKGSCACPSWINCTQNSSQVCVESRNGCKLLRNQCELEELKCRGEAFNVTNILQCRNFKMGEIKACSCPSLKACSRNTTTNVCATAINNCKLLTNECDLEAARCKGEVNSTVPLLQCTNFQPNESKSCSCPKLFNCSKYLRSICVSQTKGCKLLRNQCELEKEKCQGKASEIVPRLQCRGFSYGQQKPCFCPKLQSCADVKNKTICIKNKEGCSLLRNKCEMEELMCQGENVTLLNDLQCKSLNAGQSGACTCPDWLDCTRNSTQVCVKTEKGCKLLRNQCELEQRKCQGEEFNITNSWQCQNIQVGQLKPCSCSTLKNCNRTNTTNVCAKGTRGCKLMSNICDLELAKCKGEDWRLQNSVQCTDFSVGYSGKCFCPKLENCSQRNVKICVKNRNRCKSLRNICELELSRCKEEGFTITETQRCNGIARGSTEICKCPALERCNRRQQACGRIGNKCKLFKSDCNLKTSVCDGENWKPTSMHNCCHFRVNEIAKCSITDENSVCARAPNRQCRLFANRCQLNAINSRFRRRFTLINRNQCKCLARGRTGRCVQRPSCTIPRGNSRKVCARAGNVARWFNSQCQLQHTNFRTCRSFRSVGKRRCANIRN